MSSDPDVTRAVRSWLDEGADRLPERVLNAVLDQVPSTPQHRSWRPVWRFTTVPNILRVAAVVAAVVVVGVVGLRFLPSSGSNVGAQPTPTPSPATSPRESLAPSASLSSDLDASSIGASIAAGEHRIAAPFGKPFTLTVPDGFRLGALNAGEMGMSTTNGYVGVFLPTGVFPDPCHTDLQPAVPQTTVDGFVQALSRMTGFQAGAITDAVVDGHPAKTFHVTNKIDTSTAKCNVDRLLPMFTYVANPGGASTNGGTDELFYVFEVDGTPVFVVLDGWATDTDLNQLKDVVSTIRFE